MHGQKAREVYEFLKGGALAYTTSNGRFTGSTWKQDGACITMDINDGYVAFTGRLTGAGLAGEFVQRFGARWTYDAKRYWSGGTTREGRDWENLRAQYQRENGAARFADAAKTAERAVAAATKAFPPDDERLFMTVRDAALLLVAAGRHQQALPMAQRAATLAEQRTGKESRDHAEAMNAVGRSLTGLRKYVEAEDAFKPALAAAEKAFGPEDPLVALLLNNLGNLLSDQDRHEEAEPLLQRSLSLLDVEEPNEQALAAALNNLAVAKKEIGKLDEARMYYERSLGLMELAVGEEHRALVPILNNLVKLYEALEWTQEAAEAKARAQRIR
jgi:tetratricopeptide (TPR) repeat protein